MADVAAHVHVIGGSGFIGTRLCHRLQAGKRDFSILDREPSRAFPDRTLLLDIRDRAALERAIRPGSMIVHLAAEHRDDVRPLTLYDEVNVGGTANVVAAACARDVATILFTSTVAVYGFADINTGEGGAIRPFNAYGRTKYEAEELLRGWQGDAPDQRRLVVVRPTVVFGERNRGNVYNLLRQIASGRFLMVGSGENRKSIAYVENVAAFLEAGLAPWPGSFLFNYVDKPDFTMNRLVAQVRELMGRDPRIGPRLPLPLALAIGHGFDVWARLSASKPAISAIRVRKFTADSVYASAVEASGFVPPVPLAQALAQTVRHEFLESHVDEGLFFTE